MGYVIGSWDPSGSHFRGGSIYSGISQTDVDYAELRARVLDDVELGRRVADDLVEAGRCQAGAFDRHAFEVLLRLYPDDKFSMSEMSDEHLEYRRDKIRRLVAKRLAVPGWGERRSLCQDDAHMRWTNSSRDADGTLTQGGYHCPPPGGTPLKGELTYWAER
jgi:hypothetical protein